MSKWIMLWTTTAAVLLGCAASQPSQVGVQGIDDARFKPHWGRSEIKELRHILEPGEEINYIIYGKREDGGNGLLFATTARLLFVDKGMVYGLTVDDFPYEKISSIRYNKGLMRGKVFFSVEGYKVTFTEVLNHEAQGFVEYVSTYMENR